MEKLIQNNLAEATTEMGFPTDVEFPLQREVTLEDGTTVTIEGIVPEKMKAILNQNIESEEVQNITFKTPGENYVENNETLIKGVCQVWNENLPEPTEEQILEIGKTYNLQFKGSGMNTDTLNSFNEKNIGLVKVIKYQLPDDASEYSLCRLGIALDDEMNYGTLGINWNNSSTVCDGYFYDDMYEAIKDKIVTAEDHKVVDTESYIGEGWYNVVIVDGDLSDVTTIKLTIEKIETPAQINSATITEYRYFFDAGELTGNPDMTGLFEVFEEVE